MTFFFWVAFLVVLFSPSCFVLQAASFQVPAPIAQTPAGYNCEPLSSNFQVRWQIDGEDLNVELVGAIEEDNFMAFGPGGSKDRTQMVGSDPVVGSFVKGQIRAADFFISARVECFRGIGVCPDTSNDVSLVSGERNDSLGVTLVRYTRPLVAAEKNDITIVPGRETFISWAISNTRGQKNLPTQHDSRDRARFGFSIVFGRDVVDNCEPLVIEEVDIPVIPEKSTPATETSIASPPTATEAPLVVTRPPQPAKTKSAPVVVTRPPQPAKPKSKPFMDLLRPSSFPNFFD